MLARRAACLRRRWRCTRRGYDGNYIRVTPQGAKQRNGHCEQSGLRVGSEPQIRFRALEAELREGLAEGLIRRIEHRTCRGFLLVGQLAHAHGLRSLSWKYEGNLPMVPSSAGLLLFGSAGHILDARQRTHFACAWGRIPQVGDERIRVSETGVISLAPPALKARLAAQPGEYRAHEGPNGTLLLMRMPPQQSTPTGVRILMMGELIHRMTVVEMINLVMSSNWRGELHLVGSAGRRVLSVDQGALKNARTDVEPERLGEILVRAGLLQRAQLSPLLREQSAEKRLGQLLVERGLVAQDVLFKQLQAQAMVIFNGALLEEQGVSGSWPQSMRPTPQLPPFTSESRAF